MWSMPIDYIKTHHQVQCSKASCSDSGQWFVKNAKHAKTHAFWLECKVSWVHSAYRCTMYFNLAIHVYFNIYKHNYIINTFWQMRGQMYIYTIWKEPVSMSTLPHFENGCGIIKKPLHARYHFDRIVSTCIRIFQETKNDARISSLPDIINTQWRHTHFQSGIKFSRVSCSVLDVPYTMDNIAHTSISWSSLVPSHSLTPSKSTFTLIRPSLPRLLINWSGFTTKRYWNKDTKRGNRVRNIEWKTKQCLKALLQGYHDIILMH